MKQSEHKMTSTEDLTYVWNLEKLAFQTQRLGRIVRRSCGERNV